MLLENFSATKDNVLLAKKQAGDHVMLSHIFLSCKADNQRLIDALYSLSLKGQLPYDSPYIVVLASREDFDALEPKKASDLTVDIYIGRLLFELIAYEDTKVLFSALRSSVPFKPLPEMPQYPQTLGKSPAPAQDDRFSASGLLRRVESIGYASLTEEQRENVKKRLTVDLYPFQEQTVRWMLDKENDEYSINEHFWEERSFTDSANGKGGHFYYFPKAGEVRLHRPPQTRGGMVTEEMGLGKTVEALAVIAAQKKQHAIVELDIYCHQKPQGVSIVNGLVTALRLKERNQDTCENNHCPLNFRDEVLNDDPDKPYPKTLRVRRWPAKSTLVLCPKSLLQQWKREAEERAPSLSLVVWKQYVSPAKTFGVAVGEHAKDIVLATYDALKSDTMLSKITWKRLILDEAQVTRRSSAQVARDTFNLRSESRFLMTGTPIVKDVDDLRGELAFLRIWPFTLFEDGFWESRIYGPFLQNHSTTLLDHLLSVTMMRHTKAQQLCINLPPRSYETIEVELHGSHRAIYCFVLGCCLEELAAWTSVLRPGSIRALLRMLVSSCISPALLNLTALDLARRSTWARRFTISGSAIQRCNELKLVKISPTEAIHFLAETGSRIARDSNRARTTLHAADAVEFEAYLKMEVQDLVTVVEAKGLLSSVRGTPTRKRLAELAAGGVHRLSSDSLPQLRQTVREVGLMSPELARKLSRDRAVALLTTHYAVTKGRKSLGSIHEAGFTALTKLVEKNETPICPVCLTSIERISLTKCGHFYCVDCLSGLFHSACGLVKCAMCRRPIVAKDAVEVARQEDEAKPVDAVGSPSQNREAEEEENSDSMRQAMTFISETDTRRYSNAPRPTASEVSSEYDRIGPAPRRFRRIGRNAYLPSLDATFLRHMQAATADDAVAPKLFALQSLIRSCYPETKFCVVAETADSLNGIANWLDKQGVVCVGVGSPGWYGVHGQSLGHAAEDFSNDPSIKVFLLNTANATGLTLTAANCVVFMESMVRVTDEMQAAARVHRIGQKRPVRIVRIVARNTIEEQIMFRRGEIHNARQEANALVSPSGRELPTEDIVRLFLNDRDEQ